MDMLSTRLTSTGCGPGDTKVQYRSPGDDYPFHSTHIPPTDAEAHDIRIPTVQAEQSHIDAQSKTSEKLPNQSIQEQQGLQESVKDQRALVSPLPSRRIPPEILSEIFIQCRHLMESDSMNPLSVAQVCAHWRAIALGTPKLWSSINLDRYRGDGKKDAEMVLIWLMRSANTPLALNIHWCLDNDPVINAVIPHSYRWRVVHLHPVFSRLLQSFAGLKGRLPLLRSLEINMVWLEDDTYVFDTFAFAPQLRRGGLHRIGFQVELPWAQLTWLELSASTQSCLSLLQNCTNLVDGSFELHSSPNHPLQPILLPHLRSLHIKTFPSGWDFSNFFDRLILPALRELEIGKQGSYLSDTWTMPSLTSLVSRSSCSIERLSFKHLLAESDFIQCLIDTPSLLELKVIRYPHIHWKTDNVLSQLIIDGSGASLIPKLQVLQLYNISEFNDLLLVEMIRSRWQAGRGPLQRVEVITPDSLSFKTGLALRRLEDEGLRVRIEARG